MLTGSDLLSKVKEYGDASKSDLVRACGYVSTKKDGGERLNFTAFYEALLEAKGLSLGEGGGSKSARNRSYVLRHPQPWRGGQLPLGWLRRCKWRDSQFLFADVSGR